MNPTWIVYTSENCGASWERDYAGSCESVARTEYKWLLTNWVTQDCMRRIQLVRVVAVEVEEVVETT